MTLVTTFRNPTWLNPGARKPVPTAPRSVTRRVGCHRMATLPLSLFAEVAVALEPGRDVGEHGGGQLVSASAYSPKLVRSRSLSSSGVNPGKPDEPAGAGSMLSSLVPKIPSSPTLSCGRWKPLTHEAGSPAVIA